MKAHSILTWVCRGAAGFAFFLMVVVGSGTDLGAEADPEMVVSLAFLAVIFLLLGYIVDKHGNKAKKHR